MYRIIKQQWIQDVSQKGGESLKIDTHKLAIEMARNCLSFEKLSKSAGISRTTLQRIKSGRQIARPQTIGKLAKALEVKVEDLLKEE